MIRLFMFLTTTFCTAVVMALLVGVAILWQQGVLSADKIRDIRLVLAGLPPIGKEKPQPEAKPEVVTHDDIRQARVVRGLDLERRETELTILKTAAEELANRLISERAAFDQMQKKFRDELKALEEALASAATEQTRAVLVALPPEGAVDKLMGLELAEDVRLLKGIPEKTIAKILQQFQGTPEKEERGRQIFAALAKGDPNATVVETAARQAAPSPK